MKQSILLTGSTGYIGENLVRYWYQHDKLEIIHVNRTTGFDFSVPGWEKALPEEKVDVVVHLAQSRKYSEFPSGAQDMFRVNVLSTFELLEWATKHGVKRFVFASTGSVYAGSAKKLTESAKSAPASMYAASKLAAENLIQPYRAFFEVVITRLFSVYGPRQRNMLIPDMIERVRSGQEIRLAGGEGIYLTPLFIEDCIKVLSHLASVPLDSTQNVFNVAGDEVLSLGEIVSKIGKKLKRDPVIRITDEQPKYICGDNSRIKSYYRNAFIPFDAGLELSLNTTTERRFQGENEE